MIEHLISLVGRRSHDQAVEAVAEALRDRHWSVEKEPIVGAMRPDIVAYAPDGTAYVFEVKTGAEQAYLGAVAQVEGYRDVIAEKLGTEARGVLVFAGDAPVELDDVARNAGIELVHARSGSSAAIGRSLSTVGQD